MLQKTRGIVLRSVKYGESSLITTVFTELYGVQSYMAQGVRSAKSKQHRAGLLQPATLLDLVVYQKPFRNLQRIKEFQPAYIYTNLQEEIVKNSIALFSVEILLRLLPEHAPLPEAFDFVYNYFRRLDEMPASETANFPLFFIIQISKLMGYEIHGSHSRETPHASLHEGAFTAQVPPIGPYLDDTDTNALSKLVQINDPDTLKQVELNAQARFRLLDWYLEFLHRHTQHMGNIKSLAVLRAVLH